MQVILKQYIPKLGDKDEVVTVKTGYAVNYLIPQGLAVRATQHLIKQIERKKAELAAKKEELENQAKSYAEQLKEVKLTFRVKASETGKLFGSITNNDVAEELKKLGFEIDKKSIYIGHVKTLGTHTAHINLFKDVKVEIPVEVVAESQN